RRLPPRLSARSRNFRTAPVIRKSPRFPNMTVTKSEYRRTPRVRSARFGFRASDFLRHSNFGFRHSLSVLLLLIPICRGATNDYFRIAVVDEQTGRGVPLVELRPVNNISLWTDSNGIIAFNEPGLLYQEVYFHVKSHGYDFP